MFNASEVYYVLEDLFGQKEKPNSICQKV